MISIQRTNIKSIKMKFIPILFLFFIACTAQSNREETKSRVLYDFEILYRYQGEENFANDKLREKLSLDSLYFIIESNFNDDNIEIYTNQKNVFKGKATTEPSTGVARNVKVGNTGVKDISIAINNGPMITFELIKKENNIIGIRKKKNMVSIIFYKRVPVFE